MADPILVYTSSIPSLGERVLDTSLYAPGDGVFDAVIWDVTGASDPGDGDIILPPLSAVGWGAENISGVALASIPVLTVSTGISSSAYASATVTIPSPTLYSTETAIGEASFSLPSVTLFSDSGAEVVPIGYAGIAIPPLYGGGYGMTGGVATGDYALSLPSVYGYDAVYSATDLVLPKPLILGSGGDGTGSGAAFRYASRDDIGYMEVVSPTTHYSLFDRVIYNANMLVRRELTLALTDVLTLTHRAESTLELVASDVVALLDTLYHTLGIPVSDALSMEGMCDSTALLTSSLTEVMDYADRLGLTRKLSASETLELAGTITVGSVLARLAESYGLVGSAATTFTNYIALIADLDLSAEATDRLRLNLAAVITLVDTTRLATNYLLALSDELTLADSVSNTATFGLVATEDMTFIDALSAMLSGQSALSSVFGLIGTVLIPVGNERITWVVNAHTQAAYTFTNYDFNSFAQVGAFAYGCKSDGVYQLSGADDAGEAIPTPTLLTGMTDFDTAHLKSIPTLYLGYNSIGETLLKVRVSEAGKGEEFWYRLTEYPATEPRAARLQIGRGLKSRYWQFKIEAVDGVPAEYDSLELMPLVLQRRIR